MSFILGTLSFKKILIKVTTSNNVHDLYFLFLNDITGINLSHSLKLYSLLNSEMG